MSHNTAHGALARAVTGLLLCALATLFCFAPRVVVAQKRGSRAPASTTRATYSCPMDADVKSKLPGKCPKCGMKLVKTPPPSGNATAASAASDSFAASSSSGESLLTIPDTVVYDQHGRRLNFYTDLVKGRTVAINFIFTTCTGVCPTLTAKFRQLQQQLAARASDAQLISITVDPVTDVPERLRDYAAKFKAAPGWTFVTGSKPEVDALLRALGAAAPDKTGHPSTALVMNDAAGYRTRVSALSPASTITELVVAAEQKTPRPTATLPDAAPSSGAPYSLSTTPAAAPAAPPTDAEAKRKMVEASRKYFPNHVLLNQDGREFRFYDDLLKGKIVLINFMFTTCVGVCSPMTANLTKVRSYLGEQVGTRVSMLSISVDPTVDTPDVLKQYAVKHKAGTGWQFLTGKKENVDWVLYKLGGYATDKAQHSSVLIIGNEATGEWIKTHAMAKPSEIADAVIKLIGRDAQ